MTGSEFWRGVIGVSVLRVGSVALAVHVSFSSRLVI